MENKTNNEQSKGLGDTIAKITHVTGIDIIVKKVTSAVGKEDCGCNKRREKLNDLFPYKTEDKKD